MLFRYSPSPKVLSYTRCSMLISSTALSSLWTIPIDIRVADASCSLGLPGVRPTVTCELGHIGHREAMVPKSSYWSLHLARLVRRRVRAEKDS